MNTKPHNWLSEWDYALDAAHRHGKPGRVWVDDKQSEWILVRLSARTAHPAFLPPREAQ